MISILKKDRAPSRIEFREGLGLRRPVARLRGNGLGVEVREAVLDRCHDGIEVDTCAAVVDGVIQRLRVHAGELAELVSAKHGNRLADVTLADIAPEHVDTLLVDAERVEHQKAAEPAAERVGVHLLTLRQKLHTGRERAGIAAAHRHDDVPNRHVQLDSLVSHFWPPFVWFGMCDRVEMTRLLRHFKDSILLTICQAQTKNQHLRCFLSQIL